MTNAKSDGECCFFFFFFFEFWSKTTNKCLCLMWWELPFLFVLIVQTIGILFCDSKMRSSKTHRMKVESNNTTRFLFLASSKEKNALSPFRALFLPLFQILKTTHIFLSFFFCFCRWACFWVSLFSKDLFCLFEQGHRISHEFHTKFLQPSLCIIETCFRSTKHCHIFAIHSLFTKSSCITSQLWIHFQPTCNFLNSPFRWWFGVYSLWLIHWITVNATNIGVYFLLYHTILFQFLLTNLLLFDWLDGVVFFFWSSFTRIAGHHITTTFCLLIIKIMFKLEIKHKTKTYNCISAAGGDSWTWKLWMNKNKTKTKSHNKYSNK